MPFDTYLRPDDPFDKRYRPTYGTAPSGITREGAASDDAARRYARRRLLMSIQGGLGAGVEAGGGFFGNLTRGFAGSLGNSLQADQMQHEEERQAIRDQGEQRQAEEAQRRWEATFGVQRDTLQLAKDRETRLATQEAPQGHMSELDFFLKDPEGYKRYKASGRAPGENEDVGLVLTPEAMNLVSDQYVATGQMPPFGMGKAGASQRARVYNRAAERHPGESVATNRASFDAARGSLVKMETGLANTEAYIKSIDKNLAVLEQTIDAIPETNTRLGNRFFRALASHTGSQEMAQFNTALQVVVPELAQINSQGFLSNGSRLTDSARHDIGSVLHGDYTKKQLKSALKILRQDSQNKLTSGRAQVEQIRAKIGKNQPITGQTEEADPLDAFYR